MTGSKKPSTVTKAYENAGDRDRDVPHMAAQGYVVQQMMSEQGSFHKKRAGVMSVLGLVVLGPIGLLAGALAGRHESKWHVVYTLAETSGPTV
jgi:hypothetical protein